MRKYINLKDEAIIHLPPYKCGKLVNEKHYEGGPYKGTSTVVKGYFQ